MVSLTPNRFQEAAEEARKNGITAVGWLLRGKD